MNQIKNLLAENLNYIFTILKPYKHQKITQCIQISLEDFIQLFSRLQYIQTKLQQLFKICDSIQRSNTIISQTQKQILQDKQEILNDLQIIDNLLQGNEYLQETNKLQHDISELCGEAYKVLLDGQSFDFTKAQWDSKLESDREKTNDRESIRQAFQILDKAKMFEPDNLQILMKCAENTDKQIYLDLFLQVVNLQNKNIDRSPELREQVLQVPACQEFSFESPLPSLREQEQPQQQFHHVKLEDLLKIEERLISENSPNKFVKKTVPTKIDSSFYSQHNIKHLIKRYPNNQLKRERSPSEHISRSSCSLIEQTPQNIFRRKTSQPTSITERNTKL